MLDMCNSVDMGPEELCTWWRCQHNTPPGGKSKNVSVSRISPILETKMQLQVKILQGGECFVEVPETGLVRDVKAQVETKLGVPRSDQRLVLRGKTLQDDKTLMNYGLANGDKIFLVVKKTDAAPLSIPQPKPSPDLWTQLEALLLKHFSQSNAEKVLEEFRKDFEVTMEGLSLDDIERLAITLGRRKTSS